MIASRLVLSSNWIRDISDVVATVGLVREEENRNSLDQYTIEESVSHVNERYGDVGYV